MKLLGKDTILAAQITKSQEPTQCTEGLVSRRDAYISPHNVKIVRLTRFNV